MFKLEYYLIKLLDFILPRFSFKSIEKSANLIAFILRELFRFRRDIVKKNLDLVYNGVYPQPYKELIKNIYRNFTYLWFELLQAKKINTDNFNQHFKIHDLDILDNALKKKNGVILLTGHLGNFEWSMPFFGLKGYNLKVIMRKLKNPFVNNFIVKAREQFGCKTVYPRKAPREGFKIIKEGGILEIVGDQYAGKKGIKVDFLGNLSSTAAGAAVFHIKTQAPIVFTFFIRSRYGYFDVYFEEIKITGVNDKTEENIKEVTQIHTRVLEKWIRKYPDQWFWLHKRWKNKG